MRQGVYMAERHTVELDDFVGRHYLGMYLNQVYADYSTEEKDASFRL